MQEPSQLWPEVEVKESFKTDDISMGSRSDNTTYYSCDDIVKPLLNGFLTGQFHALARHCLRLIHSRLAQADPYFKKTLPDPMIPHITDLSTPDCKNSSYMGKKINLSFMLTRR